MWKGRFSEENTDKVLAYGESVSYDWRLYAHDIRASIAHAKALHKAAILNAEELEQISNGLSEIEKEIAAGNFEFKTELEDIHMNIESALTAKIGDAGAKLHTARSRNDQVATDTRLYVKDELCQISEQISKLQKALLTTATNNKDAVLPGYTHLQRAQPVFFAHHLLAYVEMLQRDKDRIHDASKRIDVLPLGSGALAGSTIVLDREFLAQELGFAAVSTNSMDAISDRDYVAEVLFALSLVGIHLSRLSEDIILWCSSEFGFITLSDAHTTGSSLMPQKKNPDMAELARGKTGRLIGNLVSILTTLKGLPMTYNRDLQEDKEPLFDSIDQTKMGLAVFAEMIPEMKLNSEKLLDAASDSFLLATDLADYLVLKQVPFRQAHEIVGKLTALATEKGCGIDELNLATMQSVSEAIGDDVTELFDLNTSLRARKATGAPHPERVQEQLVAWEKQLS